MRARHQGRTRDRSFRGGGDEDSKRENAAGVSSEEPETSCGNLVGEEKERENGREGEVD